MSNRKKRLRLTAVCALAAFFLTACSGRNKNVQTDENNQDAVVEEAGDGVQPDAMTYEPDDAEEDFLHGRSLNDIRFAHFKEEKDWIDNEYVRTLRRYLDDFCNKKVENEDLEPYRDVVKGKFTIFNVEPYIGGGLFLSIIFFDHPQYLFHSAVYSSVDIERETVIEYHVLDVVMEVDSMDVTQDDIREVLSEHPEYKLW